MNSNNIITSYSNYKSQQCSKTTQRESQFEEKPSNYFNTKDQNHFLIIQEIQSNIENILNAKSEAPETRSLLGTIAFSLQQQYSNIKARIEQKSLAPEDMRFEILLQITSILLNSNAPIQYIAVYIAECTKIYEQWLQKESFKLVVNNSKYISSDSKPPLDISSKLTPWWQIGSKFEKELNENSVITVIYGGGKKFFKQILKGEYLECPINLSNSEEGNFKLNGCFVSILGCKNIIPADEIANERAQSDALTALKFCDKPTIITMQVKAKYLFAVNDNNAGKAVILNMNKVKIIKRLTLNLNFHPLLLSQLVLPKSYQNYAQYMPTIFPEQSKIARRIGEFLDHLNCQ